MRVAISENEQQFSKNKLIARLNVNDLKEQISFSVVDTCGYPINLSGQEGYLDFSNYIDETSALKIFNVK